MAERKKRSDAGSRRSTWVKIPCSACGSSVERRETDVRRKVYCNLACSRADASHDARERRALGMPVGRPGVHQKRRRKTRKGSLLKFVNTPDGSRRAYRLKDGYVRIYWPEHPSANTRGNVLEHRFVMETMLGRPLTQSENVHHKNGHRDDNDEANLELWTKSQPPGQRVEDKIAWAVNFLKLYRPDLLAPTPRKMLKRPA